MNLGLTYISFCVFLYLVCANERIYEMLNTKTPYPQRPAYAHHEFIDPMECPNGKLIHYNMVARHGSRIPTKGDIQNLNNMQTILSSMGKYITNAEFFWMREWKNPYSIVDAGQLDLRGEVEHYNLSKRILNRYSPQFSAKYSPLVYPIQVTAVPRAARSGNSFGYGLFEGTGIVGPNRYQPFVTISSTLSQDIQLRFFDNCPLYTHQILNNVSWSYDSNRYLQEYSPIILSKVISRLGVNKENWPIQFSDVKTFYTACTFDIAIQGNSHLFCSLFDLDDIYRFETASDLSDYWIKGYGNAINYKISCPLLVDFWESVSNVMEGGIEQSKLRFAHAETVIPFASLLGLFKDDFQLHWNSEKLDMRNWRTSKISPFASNIALALYKCDGEYSVKLLHNELEVPVPGCGGRTYCPVDQFQSIYKEQLNCNFNEICGISEDVRCS